MTTSRRDEALRACAGFGRPPGHHLLTARELAVRRGAAARGRAS